MNATAQKIVCPPWCEIDHDARAAYWRAYEARLIGEGVAVDLSVEPDEIVDYHEFVPLSGPVSVILGAPVYADGRPGQPSVQVDERLGGVEMDAAGARQLAAALLNAADKLEEATR